MRGIKIKFKQAIIDLWYFGIKEAQSCLFAGTFFIILLLSNYISIPGIHRYDFILIASISIQFTLVFTKLETWDELKAISMFHIIGLILEIFKTHPAIGSWTYPEDGFFKIFNVPLYSGFMYASVASYLVQAWRHLKVKVHNYPSYKFSIPLGICVYLNFFTHHFITDLRWYLIALITILFWKTKVSFIPHKNKRFMPLTLAFFLVGFFIWIAENIATFWGAWKYPNQNNGWEIVHFSKISSWSLLFIMTFIIIADLKIYKEKRKKLKFANKANSL